MRTHDQPPCGQAGFVVSSLLEEAKPKCRVTSGVIVTMNTDWLALRKMRLGLDVKRRSPSELKQVIKLTTQEKPANATHWSCRLMAQQVNISESTVARIWQVHRVKPHRVSTFKLSKDKHFQEKLEDVVSLFLSPTET